MMNDFIVHTTERRDGRIAVTRVRQSLNEEIDWLKEYIQIGII